MENVVEYKIFFTKSGEKQFFYPFEYPENHIWQKQVFNLTRTRISKETRTRISKEQNNENQFKEKYVKNNGHETPLLGPPPTLTAIPLNSLTAIPLNSAIKESPHWKLEMDLEADGFFDFVYGKVYFGDCIDDEWFIVWILLSLSRQDPDLVVSVSDNDGDFLLIEAADHIPSDLEPDKMENRLFIHQGNLHLIPLEYKDLTLPKALKLVLDPSIETRASKEIEMTAFERAEKFPQLSKDMIQKTSVMIPHNAAHLLYHNPQLIAPCVEAFYTRDAQSVKGLASMKTFSPEKGLVRMTVKMTKTLYAQMKSIQCSPPPAFKEILPPSSTDESFSSFEFGMKVSCGFEILFNSKSITQEMLDCRELVNPDLLVLENSDDDSWLVVHPQEVDDLIQSNAVDISLQDLEGSDSDMSELDGFEEDALGELKSMVGGVQDFVEAKESGIKGVVNPGEEDSDFESNSSSSSDDDDDDLRPIKLNATDFLECLQNPAKIHQDPLQPTMESLMDAMDSELKGTSLDDDSFVRNVDGDVDAEATLMKNMMTSIESQQGLSGPGSNMIGSLGLKIPQL